MTRYMAFLLVSTAALILLPPRVLAQDAGCVAPINTETCLRPSGGKGVFVCDATANGARCISQSQTLGITASPRFSCGCCDDRCPPLLDCGCICDLPDYFLDQRSDYNHHNKQAMAKQFTVGYGKGVLVSYEKDGERLEHCVPPGLADNRFRCVEGCAAPPPPEPAPVEEEEEEEPNREQEQEQSRPEAPPASEEQDGEGEQTEEASEEPDREQPPQGEPQEDLLQSPSEPIEPPETRPASEDPPAEEGDQTEEESRAPETERPPPQEEEQPEDQPEPEPVPMETSYTSLSISIPKDKNPEDPPSLLPTDAAVPDTLSAPVVNLPSNSSEPLEDNDGSNNGDSMNPTHTAGFFCVSQCLDYLDACRGACQQAEQKQEDIEDCRQGWCVFDFQNCMEELQCMSL